MAFVCLKAVRDINIHAATDATSPVRAQPQLPKTCWIGNTSTPTNSLRLGQPFNPDSIFADLVIKCVPILIWNIRITPLRTSRLHAVRRTCLRIYLVIRCFMRKVHIPVFVVFFWYILRPADIYMLIAPRV